MDQQSSSPRGETDSTSVSPRLTVAIVVVACGVLFLPTPTGMTASAHRLIAVAVLMAGLWMTQAIPLAAASLLPLA
ncbi:MAG: anion permease, partial [Planctomycetaceae bacterium]